MNAARNLAWLGALSLAAAGPPGAFAQVDPDIQLGSKIPQKAVKADKAGEGDARDRFIGCTYPAHREKIDSLLAQSDAMTIDFKRAGIASYKLFDPYSLRACWWGPSNSYKARLQFSESTFRYMMLEGAYVERYKALPVNHVQILAAPRRYVSTGSDLDLARTLGAFADCIAANDPVAADTLLRTRYGSEAESAAARALVPTLSACIVAGQQLELTPAKIRAFAADGMWQRFVASPEGAG